MKTLNYYLNLPYKLEIIPDTEEGGYTAAYPELPGCITCGETVETAAANAADAKKVWLEAALAEGCPISEPKEKSDVKYSGQFKLRIPKSLHRDLAHRAKEEGISMNQYCMFLLAKNHARNIKR